ncbi:AAEL009136-PA [Aedes aegypti]|uniref:AAEL009136-PA n=1 Tax=Aedes aegypti TaxID=7159 RepID=Q16WQ2_AEDAE|nr:AAEL009136-PA [Aedes aegypti]
MRWSEPSRKFSGPSARTNRALERVESTASLSSRLAGNPSEALPSPLFYDHAVDPRRIQHTTGKAIFCPAVRRKFSYYSFRQSAEDQATTSSGSPPSDPPRTKSPSVRHSAEDQPSSVRPSADKEAIRSAVRRRPSHLQSGRPPTNKPSVRQSAEDQAISSPAVRRPAGHPFDSPPKAQPFSIRQSAVNQAALSYGRQPSQTTTTVRRESPITLIPATRPIANQPPIQPPCVVNMCHRQPRMTSL